MQLFIIARTSTDMQNPKSPEDQVREVRAGLERMGIDHSNAVVKMAHGESGLSDDRAIFREIEQRIKYGEAFILAVDDQSRFSRGINVRGLITDLVYNGGRFISTGEMIDTEHEGWESRVFLNEMHHSQSSKDTGRRVRRGHAGRVHANLSAGDYCFGFESYPVNPDYAQNYHGRGPKPEMAIRINDAEAAVVRRMYHEFVVEGKSLNAIAKGLTKDGVSKGHRSSSTTWTHTNVVEKLKNAKYIGVWEWGKTQTIRNSAGKKKQVPVEKNEIIRTKRPELGIVSKEMFDAAQKKLEHNKKIYGTKGQGRRKQPKNHHTEEYPNYLLQGAVHCGNCGKRMWIGQRKGDPMFFCPTHRDCPDRCALQARVPIHEAEQRILAILGEVLADNPEWLQRVQAAMTAEIQTYLDRLPNELSEREQELGKVQAQIDRGVDLLLEGADKNPSLNERVKQLEKRKAELEAQIVELEAADRQRHRLPDEAWVREQLASLAEVLTSDTRRAAVLLRSILIDLRVGQVIPPGKQRGFAILSFRISGLGVLRAAMPSLSLPGSADDGGLADEASETFEISFGNLSQMDRWVYQWGETIDTMRRRGVLWREVYAATGLQSGPAYTVLQRYRAWRNDQADGPGVGDDDQSAA